LRVGTIGQAMPAKGHEPPGIGARPQEPRVGRHRTATCQGSGPAQGRAGKPADENRRVALDEPRGSRRRGSRLAAVPRALRRSRPGSACHAASCQECECGHLPASCVVPGTVMWPYRGSTANGPPRSVCGARLGCEVGPGASDHARSQAADIPPWAGSDRSAAHRAISGPTSINHRASNLIRVVRARLVVGGPGAERWRSAECGGPPRMMAKPARAGRH